MQREFPAGLSVFLGGFARGLANVVGDAGELGLVGNELGEGIGRVEQVLGELRGEAREFLRDRLEARLLVFRQLGAGQAEVADLVVDDLALRRRQRGVFRTLADGLVLGEKLEVLAEFGKEARDFRQHAVVSLAPFRNVVDRMQMADDAPGARQLLDLVGERRGEGAPGGRNLVGRQTFDQRPVVRQQEVNRRLDVAWRDRVKARQAGEIEQGVGGGIGSRGHLGSSRNGLGGRSRPVVGLLAVGAFVRRQVSAR